MTGYAYFDQKTMQMIKVPLRYPEDISDPYDFELFNKYIRTHLDEKEFLVNKHQIDKRVFRRQAFNNGARDLAGSKFLDIKESNDT